MSSFIAKNRNKRRTRGTKKANYGSRQPPPPPAIATFDRPSRNQQADGNDYLSAVYKTNFIHARGEWRMGAGWYDTDQSVYYEPVPLVLSYQLPAVLDYVNDTHAKNAVFSRWWQSVCDLPAITLIMNELILLQRLNIFIITKDVMPRERTFIYPGYEKVVIGSGFEISFAGPTVSYNADPAEAIEIFSNDELTRFANYSEAKHHYIYIDAHGLFFKVYGFFQSKVRKGARSGRRWVKYPISMFVWSVYLKKACNEHQIGYRETTRYVQVETISREQAKETFGHGTEYEKADKVNKYFMEQIDIYIDKEHMTMKINGIQCNKTIKHKLDRNGRKKKRVLNGRDLLRRDFVHEESDDDQ